MRTRQVGKRSYTHLHMDAILLRVHIKYICVHIYFICINLCFNQIIYVYIFRKSILYNKNPFARAYAAQQVRI